MQFIIENWLGILGFISGILCVWLLIRENVLTFPIGLFYAFISVLVMYEARLYADTLLNFYYVVMNGYGWYFWLKGGDERRRDDYLLIEWMPVKQWSWVVGLGIAGTILMGWAFDTLTNAALPYPDSFTTIVSFLAMWMSAKKYMDSWFLWLVVNVVSVALYLIKAQEVSDLYFWAILYAIYIAMAFSGYRTWRRQMLSSQAA